MFRKLLPVLLFLGCQKESTTSVETAKASFHADAAKTESRGSMYRSADLGRTWIPTDDGLPEGLQVSLLDTFGNRILLASRKHGLFLSDEKKQHWRQLDTLLMPNRFLLSLHVSEGIIYAGLHEKGIYASYDLGTTWACLNYDLPNNIINSIQRVGDELWVAAGLGIYSLKDGTHTWRETFQGSYVNSLKKLGDGFVASTNGGILFSKDGNSWRWVRQNCSPFRLSVTNDQVVAMYMTKEVMEISNDMGQTWQSISSGLPVESNTYDVLRIGNYWISSQGDGIYRRKNGDEKWVPVFEFPGTDPASELLKWNPHSDEIPSKDWPFVDLIEVDGIMYGGISFGGGC